MIHSSLKLLPLVGGLLKSGTFLSHTSLEVLKSMTCFKPSYISQPSQQGARAQAQRPVSFCKAVWKSMTQTWSCHEM